MSFLLSPRRQEFTGDSQRIVYRFPLAQVNDCLARWGWRARDGRFTALCSHRRHLFGLRHIIQRICKKFVKFAVGIASATLRKANCWRCFTRNDQLAEFLAAHRRERGNLAPAGHAVCWKSLAKRYCWGCEVCHGCLTLHVAAVIQRIDARVGLMARWVTEFGFLKSNSAKWVYFPRRAKASGICFSALRMVSSLTLLPMSSISRATSPAEVRS